MSGVIQPTFIPNELQATLLRAALLSGDSGKQAWESWQARSNLESLDYASFRLLPLVYSNQSRLENTDHPEFARLKGTVRLTWSKNQLLLRSLQTTLGKLEQQGIEPVALKGSALLMGGYQPIGGRPMHDLDILIKPDEVGAVKRCLEELGWQAQSIRAPLRKFRREQVFHNDQDQELDLHWHLLPEWCQPDQNDVIHQNTRLVRYGEQDIRILNPTFMLLHLIGHGYQWSPLPNMTWIADCWQLLTAAETQGPEHKIDWPLFLEWVQRFEITSVTHQLFNFLDQELSAPIPETTINSLRNLKPTKADLAALDVRGEAPNTARRVLKKHWLYYSSTQQSNGLSRNWFGFVHYFSLHFQDVWNLKFWWQTPFVALKRWLVDSRVKGLAELQ